MSTISLGLAESVREWFAAGEVGVSTAVQTAPPVEASKARPRARKKKVEAESADQAGGGTAVAVAEAPAAEPKIVPTRGKHVAPAAELPTIEPAPKPAPVVKELPAKPKAKPVVPPAEMPAIAAEAPAAAPAAPSATPAASLAAPKPMAPTPPPLRQTITLANRHGGSAVVERQAATPPPHP